MPHKHADTIAQHFYEQGKADAIEMSLQNQTTL